WFLGMGVLVWVTLALFIAMSARWRRAGRSLGPEMPIGIPNRVFAAAYVVWTVAIALSAWPLSGSRGPGDFASPLSQRRHSFTIYRRRSRNPRPSKIAGIAFSIRAVRVPDCLAPVK